MRADGHRGRTAVITGGNSGIGFETARILARQGWRVIITGRSRERLAAAVQEIGREQCQAGYRVGDFASFASVRALAAELAALPRLDVLINNAGIALSSRRVSADGNDLMLQVNHLAPFLLTSLLLDRIKSSAPARIINVSSRFHRLANGYGFEDFQFARRFSAAQAYARTKLYNILFTRELARRLAGTGVTVNALHPGALATRIGMDGDMSGLLTVFMAAARRLVPPPERGAAVAVFAATAPDFAAVSGKYITPSMAIAEPSPLARDADAARRLWDLSAALTGVPEGADR